MKKTLPVVLFIGLSTTFLGGCTNTEVGTVAGGAAGAGIGYAVSGGSALGTVIGAGAGALIGNSIGQSQDRRDYYYRDRYYYY
ncbi:MAG: glycine zipper domain-containing protein [Legionella sp.]|nr:glycine zipper domain-containing protein [Legionella sp.]